MKFQFGDGKNVYAIIKKTQLNPFDARDEFATIHLLN